MTLTFCFLFVHFIFFVLPIQRVSIVDDSSQIMTEASQYIETYLALVSTVEIAQ